MGLQGPFPVTLTLDSEEEGYDYLGSLQGLRRELVDFGVNADKTIDIADTLIGKFTLDDWTLETEEEGWTLLGALAFVKRQAAAAGEEGEETVQHQDRLYAKILSACGDD